MVGKGFTKLGTSCPDHFLRTKVKPLVLDLPADAPVADAIARLKELHAAYREDYRGYYERNASPDSPALRGADPLILLVPGVGMFSYGANKQTARVAGEFYVNAINVMRAAEGLSTYAPISEAEKFNIEYWALEEAKLQRMPKPKPLATRIALVTGAASGFGKAIAMRLAAEGACDLAAETRHAGAAGVPHVVPDVLRFGSGPMVEQFKHLMAPTAIWGAAAVWVPQALWQAYGDRERLAAHYPGMALHLESVVPLVSETGLWDTGFQFGDWLDPDASPHEPWNAKVPGGVVATASLYRSAAFADEAAAILGKDDDAARWSALAERTRAAFRAHYVSEDGRVESDCATAYALAIQFGLLDGDQRDLAADRLAEVVRERDYRVTTGFAGTPYVTWALSETGHVADAYRLLLETECPSWLYPVTIGATTIWERWDSMLPDGSINPGEMTSFNHYALGAVADWLYQVVAGIRPAAPGYARLRLQPTPGAGLDWARASLETRHGRVESGWRRVDDGVEVRVVAPAGVEADVVLPDGSNRIVDGGEHVFTVGSSES